MNKILITLLVTGTLFAVSCKIDKAPYDSITSDDLKESETSVESATIGTYARLKAWTENWHRLNEYPSDNVALSGTTTDPLFFTYNYQRIPNGHRVDGFWKSSYQVIIGANKTIEAIVEGESLEKDQILAENYYLRAMVQFAMVNVFGKPYSIDPSALGVPIKLDGDPKSHPARSSVSDNYAQIEGDLLHSVELFNTDKSNAYASKEAAWALLSRLYLYKEQNQDAIDYADKVINSGRFSMLTTANLPNYAKLSPETNTETIFAVKFVKDADYDDGWGTVGSMYASIKGSGYGELYASRSYLELIRVYPEDIRNKFIEPVVVDATVTWASYVDDNYQYVMNEVTQTGDDYSYQEGTVTKKLIKESNGSGSYLYFIEVGGKKRRALIDKKLDVRNGYPKYYVLKASNQEEQPQLWSPVVSRLAEMYLNRAEAFAKLGNQTNALADVNLIRSRAGIPTSGLYTAGNLKGQSNLEVVLQERQLELAWEGHRKFDVFRNKRTLDRRYPGTHLAGSNPIFEVRYTDNAIVEFLPESQILVQENLVQNQ